MSTVTNEVASILADIKPLLQQGGKDIVLVEAREQYARFRLDGFCSGCGCGESYRDGIREMLQTKMPDLQIEFE